MGVDFKTFRRKQLITVFSRSYYECSNYDNINDDFMRHLQVWFISLYKLHSDIKIDCLGQGLELEQRL